MPRYAVMVTVAGQLEFEIEADNEDAAHIEAEERVKEMVAHIPLTDNDDLNTIDLGLDDIDITLIEEGDIT